jgi:hypothetical protein
MSDMGLPAMEIPKGITAEDVWAILRDTALQQKETDKQMKETQRIVGDLGKAHRETEKALKEAQRIVGGLGKDHKETEKALKETQRIVGGLGNRFGDIAEKMLVPALVDKFEKFGFTFGELSHNVKWKNKKHNLSVELDALLENGKQAMVVEVKVKLDRANIDEQIGRMEKVRRYADMRGDERQFFCAMAALTASDNVIEYALANGFYLIMPSGEDVKITEPVFEPRVW